MRLPLHLAPVDEPLVLWDVVEEHLEEASSLWSDRERGLYEPRASADIAALERRLRAHLDGILWSGAVAPEKLVRSAQRARDPGATFAVTFALASRDEPDAHLFAISILTSSKDHHRAAALRAFALLRATPRSLDLQGMLASTSNIVRVAGLAVCRARRLDPGRALREALVSSDVELRCAALRLVASRGDSAYMAEVVSELSDADPEVRSAALHAGLILGLREARAACRSEQPVAKPGEVLLYRALLGEEDDIAALLSALDDPSRRLDALFALGFTGAPAAAAACVAACDDPTWGPTACEAFSAIMDVDPVKERIAFPAPPPLSEVELPSADRLRWKPEELLPIPDATAARALWETRRSSYTRAALTVDALTDKFVRTSMRRRHVLGTHVALWTRGGIVIDTTSWLDAQARTISMGVR